MKLRHTALGRTPVRQVFGPSQGPLPDDSQHSQGKNSCPPMGFKFAVQESERT